MCILMIHKDEVSFCMWESGQNVKKLTLRNLPLVLQWQAEATKQ